MNEQENALGRSTRLLVLLQDLRRRHQPVTAATLARELEVSERTIYRDLSDLAAQGAAIKGEAGIGYVLRPGFFLPPLMLTRDETEAVLLGLRYVDQRGDDVLSNASANARAKISSILSEDMRAVANAPMTIPGPDGKRFPENKVPLTLFRSAIRMRKRLSIDYVDQASHHSRRVVWPLQIAFMDDARVLAGWCELRDAYRFFRIDRILTADLRECYPARRAELLRNFQTQMQNEMRGDLSVTTDRKAH